MLLITSPYGFIGDSAQTFVKAQKDVVRAVEEMGGRALPVYNHLAGWDATEDELTKRLDGLMAGVEPGDTVIVQIPLWTDPHFEERFINRLRAHDVKMIAFVHDILAWMRPTVTLKIEQTLAELQKFDAIVAHTPEMIARLHMEADYDVPMVALDLFDFRHGIEVPNPQPFVKQAYHAGNAEKVLDQLETELHFDLKVLAFNPPVTDNPRVSYAGFYQAANVPIAFEGGFGIVWGAEDVPDLLSRTYSLVNLPHKASLYLSANLPIIVQDDVPLARFVQERGIGWVVKDFQDINRLMDALTEAEYDEMSRNAAEIGQLVREGFFAKRAVIRAIGLANGIGE
jgi:hypothetical protein